MSSHRQGERRRVAAQGFAFDDLVLHDQRDPLMWL
jgi:hypothetical protein